MGLNEDDGRRGGGPGRQGLGLTDGARDGAASSIGGDLLVKIRERDERELRDEDDKRRKRAV